MKILQNLAAVTALSVAATSAPAAAPGYHVDPAKSTLGFTATQEGAKFDGSFTRFTATIAFSPAELATSRFDVTVDPASGDTKDAERNSTLKGSDFFDVAKFPKAHFVTSGFTKVDAIHFAATGSLTIRDVTRPVSIAFTFTTRREGADDVAYLVGTSNLKRLAFGLGQGDYADTDSLADDVQVKFSLRLLPDNGRKQIPQAPTATQAQ